MDRLEDIEAWVGVEYFTDKAEAKRIVTAIYESGSNYESEWFRMADAPVEYILQGAQQDYSDACKAVKRLRWKFSATEDDKRKALAEVDKTFEMLKQEVRSAYKQGMSKEQVRKYSKVAPALLDEWLVE